MQKLSILPILFMLITGPMSSFSTTHPSSLTRSGTEISGVSPYYYGPNAFPIPEIPDSTSSKIQAGIYTDIIFGTRKDLTLDAGIHLRFPLWTQRVNLSAWWTVREWWHNSETSMDVFGIPADEREMAKSGTCGGDIYISTDILALTELKYRPSLIVRCAFKTASGGHSYEHRYYDSPGYFFDATALKSFSLIADRLTVRTGASVGFLCWQTGQNRQNDAVMVGIKASLRYGHWEISEAFNGYIGWESGSCVNGDMAHDAPLSLRTYLGYQFNKIALGLQYQAGVHDYPYHQFRFSATWLIPVPLYHR